MVRKREPRRTLSEKSIDAFAAGADKPAGALDEKAARNYKYLKVSFNEYEYTRLKAACDAADRGVLDYIRRALKTAIDKELG